IVKLEYRILEVAEKDNQDCNYCLLDFHSGYSLILNVATHQLATFKDNGDYVYIAYICGNRKEELENDILPHCELCGRLKRNRKDIFT
ncbi:6966_t:CDS:2, partial [Entrophospora sp. SA101]